MPINYNEGSKGSFDPNEVFFPKVGQSKEMHIVSTQKVFKEGFERNFKSKTENYGYHYKIDLGEGKYAIMNTFALFTAFKDNNIQDGDTVMIDHPAFGVYTATRKTSSEIASKGSDLDYLKEIEKRRMAESEESAKAWDE